MKWIFENILKRSGSSSKYFKEDKTPQENGQRQPWILSRYEEFSENDLANFKVSKKKNFFLLKLKLKIKVTC